MKGDRLQLPTGKKATPQEILLGMALIEIGSDNDLTISTLILKYARAIKAVM